MNIDWTLVFTLVTYSAIIICLLISALRDLEQKSSRVTTKDVSISLTCNELADIYMALNIVIKVFGKHDLVSTRNKIAKVLLEKCKVIGSEQQQ